MGLKCSVFGHAYADTDVQRERDEQGSEVVITIREVETCQRCGEERVVSENKEVTTLETPDIDPDPTPDDDGESLVADSTGTDHGAGARDAEVIDEADAAVPDAETGDAAGEATPEPDPAPADLGGEPAPDSPDPAEDDGVILDEEPEEPPAERQPGEWPEDSEDDEPDWVAETEPIGAPPEEERTQDLESASSAVTVPEGEFRCPECGFTTTVESSSLRKGDFCPECHTGSLEHHPAAE